MKAALPPFTQVTSALPLQVYTVCCEALRDCPSCAPALDVLAQFYEVGQGTRVCLPVLVR